MCTNMCLCVCLARGKGRVLLEVTVSYSQHVWLFVSSINLTQGGSDGSVVHMKTLEAQEHAGQFVSAAPA